MGAGSSYDVSTFDDTNDDCPKNSAAMNHTGRSLSFKKITRYHETKVCENSLNLNKNAIYLPIPLICTLESTSSQQHSSNSTRSTESRSSSLRTTIVLKGLSLAQIDFSSIGLQLALERFFLENKENFTDTKIIRRA
uniref:Uncharacterized protein n=1 Tax=Romanomermis culicivorax TaxID=13658 RepID=A0A915JX16_ROMCU